MINADTVKKLVVLALLSVIVLIPVFSQEKAASRDDFWACPVFETGWYGIAKPAFGGGAALGYGDGVSLGIKVIYLDDINEFRTVELNFLLRFYPAGMISEKAPRNSGLFLQLNGGPVIFARSGNALDLPSQTGTFSGGLSLGWRFPLGRYFFIEPAVRGGYPYVAGAGLSAGLRF
jgi:hypothetical protein